MRYCCSDMGRHREIWKNDILEKQTNHCFLDDTESMRKISALQKRLEQEVIAGSQKLFVSPMLRCRQTAELLFPGAGAGCDR